MTYHPETIVKLESHTDPIGKSDFNKGLDLDRANVDKDFLNEEGIERTRITPNAGEDELIDATKPAYALYILRFKQ